jgi:hypothetical protein
MPQSADTLAVCCIALLFNFTNLLAYIKCIE